MYNRHRDVSEDSMIEVRFHEGNSYLVSGLEDSKVVVHVVGRDTNNVSVTCDALLPAPQSRPVRTTEDGVEYIRLCNDRFTVKADSLVHRDAIRSRLLDLQRQIEDEDAAAMGALCDEVTAEPRFSVDPATVSAIRDVLDNAGKVVVVAPRYSNDVLAEPWDVEEYALRPVRVANMVWDGLYVPKSSVVVDVPCEGELTPEVVAYYVIQQLLREGVLKSPREADGATLVSFEVNDLDTPDFDWESEDDGIGGLF